LHVHASGTFRSTRAAERAAVRAWPSVGS
jgi:hypothetical protein